MTNSTNGFLYQPSQAQDEQWWEQAHLGTSTKGKEIFLPKIGLAAQTRPPDCLGKQLRTKLLWKLIEAFYNFPEACFVPIHGSSRGVLSTLQQLFQPTAPSDALVGLELTSAVGFRTKLSRGQPRGFNRAGSAKWNPSHQVEGQTKEAHSLSWVRRQSDGQITLICPLKPTLQLARVHRNCSIGKLILPRQQVPRGVTEPKAENDPIFRAFISSQNKQVPPNTNTGGSHTKINHYKSLSSSMNSIALKKIIMVYLLCRGPVLEVSGNCFTT